MKTKQTEVKQDLADAVKNLRALLKRDFGMDFAYVIMGKGHYIARATIEGLIEPLAQVANDELGYKTAAANHPPIVVDDNPHRRNPHFNEKTGCLVLKGWDIQEGSNRS